MPGKGWYWVLLAGTVLVGLLAGILIRTWIGCPAPPVQKPAGGVQATQTDSREWLAKSMYSLGRLDARSQDTKKAS